ncbi:MAG: restriction endonuclease subunit S [Oxalobacter sp.]|nr:restriction endonuclease subunit S [Oxalobacter sp.]
MDTTALRQKLLDLAIRGRLVPQDPDEPAVELDAKDTVPESEQPFEIPENWRWVRLGKIVNKAKQKIPQEDFLYIDVGSIKNDKGVLGELKPTTSKEAPSRARKVVKEGAVLYSTVRPYLLNTCVADNLPEEEVIASTGFAVMEMTDFINNHFLHFILRSEFFSSYATKKQKGASYPAINEKDFFLAPIPLPPLPEQERIVAKLERLFEVINRCEEAQKQIAETATQLRTSLLQAAIQGRLVPQNPDEQAIELDAEDIVPESEQPFEIPENWRWVKLGHIGDWRSGSTPKRNILAYYENGNIPWLKTGDLTDGIVSSIPECITEKAFSESSMRLNPKGSVLIAMYGATIGKLGILDIESTTNQACCACIADNNLIINWFLFYYLLSQRKEFIALGAGGAQPNISRQKIISYPIPLPPLPEQERIVAKLEQLFNTLKTIEKVSS